MRAAPAGPPLPEEEAPLPPSDPGQYHSFVVRVFSRGGDGGLVQGQVTHVASRRTLRFTDVSRIIGFILGHVQDAASADTPRNARAELEDHTSRPQ